MPWRLRKRLPARANSRENSRRQSRWLPRGSRESGKRNRSRLRVFRCVSRKTPMESAECSVARTGLLRAIRWALLPCRPLPRVALLSRKVSRLEKPHPEKTNPLSRNFRACTWTRFAPRRARRRRRRRPGIGSRCDNRAPAAHCNRHTPECRRGRRQRRHGNAEKSYPRFNDFTGAAVEGKASNGLLSQMACC